MPSSSTVSRLGASGTLPQSYFQSLPSCDIPVACNLNDSEAALAIQAKAIKSFNEEFPATERLRIDPTSKFADVLADAQSAFLLAQTKKSPVCVKIERFLRRLNEYAVVGDIMCQTNTEVGSLAWGGCRLVLKAALSNFEYLERILDILDEIFRLLGRVELYSSIFTINRLQEGVATLYSYILEFVQKAMVFLKKSGLKRLTSTLWRPYQTEFQSCQAKIKNYAEFVEKEAHAANMAFLQKQNEELQRKLNDMSLALTVQNASMSSMSAQVESLHLYQTSERDLIRDIRIGENRILARRLTKYISATDFIDNASLVLSSSRTYLPSEACTWVLSNPTFLAWKNTPDLNFLALVGGRSTGKYVLASFITGHLLDDPKIGKNVVWFHDVLWSKEELTPALMLRCFIAQLLRNRPDILSQRSSGFYKKRFKMAKDLTTLFSLFVDIVSVVGKIYLMLDGLDSCPNNALLADSLLQLSEGGFPIKIIITAMESPNLGPVIEGVAKIRLVPQSVSCDISQYVSNQLTTNFPNLKHIHSDLAIAIVTGAGGNVGWARYIIWGLANATDEESIETWRKIASKGRDVVYARQFDDMSRSLDSRTLGLIRLALRALLAANTSLTPDEVHDNIISIHQEELQNLLNTFDSRLWNKLAVESALEQLLAETTSFITHKNGRYDIADSAVKEYLFEHVPSQRPPIPHLWLPTDTCMLRCQLKHHSHKEEFANGSLHHARADFKDYIIEPGSFRQNLWDPFTTTGNSSTESEQN